MTMIPPPRDQNILIWGTGREGLAAAHLLRRHHPDIKLQFFDENQPGNADEILSLGGLTVGTQNFASALEGRDMLVKSPGVSLYHPLMRRAQQAKIPVTSLLNLWMEWDVAPLRAAANTLEGGTSPNIIAVTGTKGKSTTATLCAHILNHLGKKAVLWGNIGQAVGECDVGEFEYVVLELSSYQTADFGGVCDCALLTSLYPEHLDWHGSLNQYYRDKLNLLGHARQKFAAQQTRGVIERLIEGQEVKAADNATLHDIHYISPDPDTDLIKNDYLKRPHNLANVALAVQALESFGFDRAECLKTLSDFKGLPHRQQELGIINNILYVDDSISTTPQSAIAALEIYKGRPISIIVGGFDRGIDYAPLVDCLRDHTSLKSVITMGPSGDRIYNALNALSDAPPSQPLASKSIDKADSMAEAVSLAQKSLIDQEDQADQGGVILLSPAAPSYGLYKNFIERGLAFQKEFETVSILS